MSSNVDTIKSLYAKFGTGDVPGILDLMDDSVVFNFHPTSISENPLVPYAHKLTGKDGVLKFFEHVAANEQVTKFDVQAVVGEGELVFVLIDDSTIVKSTGKTYSQLTAQIWKFNTAGKIVAWQGFNDTKAMIDAHTA